MTYKFDNRIYVLVEHRKTLWAALIVLLGGIAGLILSIDELILNYQIVSKLILLLISLVLLYFVFNGISDTNKAIAYCFKQEK